MKAMILSAGIGSRLYPITEHTPKPMLSVLNKPVLEHSVELCKKHNISDIMMNLHYLPEQIDSYFGSGEKFGVKIHYSLEKKLLGTAGSLKRVQSFFNDTFVVLSGDGFSDIDLTEMYNYHKAKKSKVTIAVKKTSTPQFYGITVSDEKGKILFFQEKPSVDKALSDKANLGIYIIEPEILSLIKGKTEFDFAKDLFPILLKENISFYSYNTNCEWTDIGNTAEYLNFNIKKTKQLKNSFLPKGYKEAKPGVYIHTSTKISRNQLSNISGPVMIGENVKINNSVINGPTVIGNYVSLFHSKVSDSVILDNTYVGKNMLLNKCIVNKNSLFSTSMDYGTIISNEKKLAPFYPSANSVSKIFISFFEKTAAFFALMCLSPLFAICALAIKLESKGPVFYKSQRTISPGVKRKGNKYSYSINEKLVNYIVFRTMYVNADKKLGKLKNKYSNGPFVKIENDPRITKVGKILRKTSIDELPLLWNILTGEMSLVGIWALPKYEAAYLNDKGLSDDKIDLSETGRVRFNGKIGLAGYWQSRGRSSLTAIERALHDSFQAALTMRYKVSPKGIFPNFNYVKQYFGLLFETLRAVILKKGAM